MNTYEQDTTIPIYIMLQYDGLNAMKFPINPETLKVNIDSASTTTNVEGIGGSVCNVKPETCKTVYCVAILARKQSFAVFFVCELD